MKQKTLLTLGAATVVALAATAKLQSGRDGAAQPASTEAALLPALSERVNEVREIRIQSASGPTTLRSSEEGWVLVEAAGYPANEEKVRTFLLGLRDARRIEAKTANPERHARLGLVAPDSEGAVSVRVTLTDAQGAPIETVLVGKQRTSRAEPAAAQMGVTPDAQYYTLPGAGPQSFLAAGDLGVDSRAMGWLNQEFLNIDRSRIQSATITHPDGQRVVAVREAMDQNEMVVQDLPEGMVPKTPSGTAQLVGALQRLRFDDVREAAALEWPAEILTSATFGAEDGLQVTVETMKVAAEDDPEKMVTWARLAFELAPDVASATGDEDDATASRAEREAELSALKAATNGWAYALPTWKENAFRLRLEAVMEAAPEAILEAENPVEEPVAQPPGGDLGANPAPLPIEPPAAPGGGGI